MVKNVPLLGLIIAVVLVLGGTAYFLYTKNNANIASSVSLEATMTQSTSTQQAEYSEYIRAKAEEVAKKEFGVSGTAIIAKPTATYNSGPGIWVLTVPINSLQQDLFITPDKEGTPWMDHARFDRELTEFEKKEKENLAERKATWGAIIADPNKSGLMIQKIQNEYIPIWQNSLKDLQSLQTTMHAGTTMFESRFGVGTKNVPTKYLASYQLAKDTDLAIEGVIDMTGTNLKIKEQTIKNIQNKDVDATVMAANDEDRISLVGGWYEERLRALMQKQQDASQLLMLNQLIQEYPKQ